MPKIKTHSGAKKRFNLTKNGKVKRAHAFKSHILNKKTTKRKRNLRKTTIADKTNTAAIRSTSIIHSKWSLVFLTENAILLFKQQETRHTKYAIIQIA